MSLLNLLLSLDARKKLAFVALTLVATSIAHGASYTFSDTLDLHTPTSVYGANKTDEYDFTGTQPTFQLSPGDTLSGTVTFGGDILTVNSPAQYPDFLSIEFQGQGSQQAPANSNTNYSFNFQLIGVNGSLTSVNPYIYHDDHLRGFPRP